MIVTVEPATEFALLRVTRYFAGEPATKSTVALDENELPLSVPVIVAVPSVVDDVSVLV